MQNVTETEAEEITNIYDNFGDWVCINIKEMTYERAVEVCQHEVGHELFAEVCETNNKLCLEVQELLRKYTKE